MIPENPKNRSTEKLMKTIGLATCLLACMISPLGAAQDAPAQNATIQNMRQYSDGPVIEEDYIEVEYGHDDEYLAWLHSKWKPTMEALKKAGLIIDYHVFRANPRSPGLPNFILWITFENGAGALDRQAEIDAVTDRIICSAECQNKARVFRNQYRKVLGTELIRELVLP